MTRQIVWIEWSDSASQHGWTDEPQPPASIVSCGFLVHEDEASVQLATSVDTDSEMWNCSMTVPKNLITKRDNVHIGWGPDAS